MKTSMSKPAAITCTSAPSAEGEADLSISAAV